MCSGPIKVRWTDRQGAAPLLDDRLVVLLAADFVEMHPVEPHVAQINELDFFFLVKEDVPAAEGEVSFWFPYPSDGERGMRFSLNDRRRLETWFPYYWSFLKQSLTVRRPTLPESFAWNERFLRQALPPESESTRDAASLYQELLLRFAPSAEGGGWVDARLDLAPLTFPGDQRESQQHFMLRIRGDLRQGDRFLVSFRAREALCARLDERVGQAVFYYYDDAHHPLVTGHPLSDAALVPCAALHSAIRFLQPPVRFETDTERRPTFKRAAMHLGRSATSPTGYEYEDMRWFTIFNAHLGPQNGEFIVQWEYDGAEEGEREVTPGLDSVRPDLHDPELVAIVVERLRQPGLTPTQKQIVRRFVRGASARAIARDRALSVKTVRNHYSNAMSRLGLVGNGLTSAARRRLLEIALHVATDDPDHYGDG